MSLSAELRAELFGLIDRQHEGTDTPEDRNRLHDLLVQDPLARAYYLEQLYLAAHLRWAQSQGGQPMPAIPEQGNLAPVAAEANAAADSKIFVAQPDPPAGHALGASPRALGIVVAALLGSYFVLMLCMVAWERGNAGKAPENRPGSNAKYFVTLTKTVDCRWKGDAPHPGERFCNAALDLDQGLAELHFDDGSQLVIEGPARFELQRPGEIFLGHGRLVALVPTAAVGFAVETPTSVIVDRGTEFAVDAELSGRVEVHVFRGLVDWEARETAQNPAPARPRRLTAGESLSFDAATSALPIVAGASAEKFVRALAIQVNQKAATWPLGDPSIPLPFSRDLALWLDANDVDGDGGATNAPAPASVIATWVNKAAGGGKTGSLASNAQQAAISLQPVYRPGKAGSVSCVEFRGDQTAGQCLDIVWEEPGSRFFTIFLVGLCRGNGTGYATDYFLDGLKNKTRVSLSINPTGRNREELGACLGTLDTMVTVPWQAAQWQSWHLYSIVSDAGACELSIDGVTRGRGSFPSVAIQGLRLGSRYSDEYYLDGAIGEVLVYQVVLSAAERSQIDRYLLTKWGLR